MILKAEKHRMIIKPENEVEEAYIEAVFGLKEDGDWVKCRRVSAGQLSRIAYLEIKQFPTGAL